VAVIDHWISSATDPNAHSEVVNRRKKDQLQFEWLREAVGLATARVRVRAEQEVEEKVHFLDGDGQGLAGEFYRHRALNFDQWPV
jgi:hypothetical protein